MAMSFRLSKLTLTVHYASCLPKRSGGAACLLKRLEAVQWPASRVSIFKIFTCIIVPRQLKCDTLYKEMQAFIVQLMHWSA